MVLVGVGGFAGIGEAGGYHSLQRAAVQEDREVHQQHERDRGRGERG